MIRTADPAPPAPPTSPASTAVRLAFGLAASGALCGVVGPVVSVVDGGAPPAFTAWPLLAVLALLPVGVAAFFLARREEATAAAVLVPAGVFAVGRFLADLQILADPVVTARPELFRPTTLDSPSPTVGLWLLLAGHLLTLVAGVLAATRTDPDGGKAERFGLPTTAGVVAAVGLFMAPFSSSDAFVPAGGPLDAPPLALVGGLLVALAVPVLAVLAASSGDPDVRRGGLLGIAAVLVVLGLPGLVTAIAVDRVDVAPGPFLVLAAAVAFVWSTTGKKEHDLELPGRRRLNLIAASLGVATGACAAVGALTDHLHVPAGVPVPTDYAARLLWPVAIVVTVLALIPKARPAFIAALAAVPLATGLALDAAFNATRVPSVEPGTGVWFTALAALPAAAAAITAALAGAVGRDEEGVARTSPPLPLVATNLTAALLALGAFGLPVLKAPDYVPITAFGLRVGSWGLLIALLAVLAAAGVALVSRPGPGAALLLGAACVTATRALEYPLTESRAAETAPGPGLWLALATTLVLLIAAAVRTAR
ncbi:hypothetical protein FHS29_001527 [Saccharothrix tamanrassetensis]|uniref:Uncharacterized protein n=1 Tax=Saccharothrix tamanrassetensis TaxID=1051531 RepID=A0A841CFM2_9PSEU|nr:hypothetical protein [Saccharothrix tamanrassetensis]MBB5954957.1 hypothetical protein [Saccharothrix tamanrassetensis]